MYVGQTKRSVKTRWIQHCQKAPSRGKCTALYGAIQKYGKENFTIEVIDQVESKSELSEKERYWIKHLNTLAPNGYNLTEGGESTVFTEEALVRMKLKQREWFDTHDSMSCKPVYQYTLTGEFIREWKSLKQASSELQINHGNLCQACRNGKNKSAGGYLWSYEKINSLQYNCIRTRKVKCVETGQIFDSVHEAAEFINRSPSSLVGCLKGKQQTSGGYHWEYYEEAI